MTKKQKTKAKNSPRLTTETERGLTLMQEEFCQAFLNRDVELYGNGTKAYLATYGKRHFEKTGKQMKYEVAASLATETLKKTYVIERINKLLETGGLNDENVDRQLLFVVNQSADLSSKIRGISEYNKLKARITTKMDLLSGGKAIKGNTIIFKSFKDATNG